MALHHIGQWLYRRAENILALMLLGMFAAFLLQIAFRYLLNMPIGWTNEISVVLWIWLVLWGAAFVLRDSEEIRFDLFYSAANGNRRRLMLLSWTLSVAIIYLLSLPAVYDYVAFMRVERTAYLKIRFDWLFSVYVIFAVATIIRYFYMAWRAMRGHGPADFDPTKTGSGI